MHQSHPPGGSRNIPQGDPIPSTVAQTTGLSGSSMPRVSRPLPQPLENFEFNGVLGEGGLGIVYRAHEKDLGRDVAIKTIQPHLRADKDKAEILKARFELEISVAAQLDHANILPIYSQQIGEDGTHYLVMKLVEGENPTLQHRLRELHATEFQTNAKQSVRDLLNIFTGVCNAIRFAHSKGVIHRDIKPANIFRTGWDETNETLVSDFGLAKLTDEALERFRGIPTSYKEFQGSLESTVSFSPTINGNTQNLTMAGEVLGTPHYMAPEQAWGKPERITMQTDIYQLGALMYEMLTGRPPFHGVSGHQLLEHVMDKRPPEPYKVNDLVPPQLSDIAMKALEKTASDRYSNVDELIEDVRNFEAFREVSARKASFPERLYRKALRNPRVSISMASAAIAVSGTAGMLTMRHTASENQRIVSTIQNIDSSQDDAISLLQEGLPVQALGRLQGALALANGDEALAESRDEVRELYEEIQRYQAFKSTSEQALRSGVHTLGGRFKWSELVVQELKAPLEVYGILDNPNWIENVDISIFTPEQVTELKQTVDQLREGLALRWTFQNPADERDPTLSRKAITLLDQMDANSRSALLLKKAIYQDLKYSDDSPELKAVDLAIENTPARTVQDYCREGRVHSLVRQDEEAAVEAYRSALSLNPADIEANYYWFSLHRQRYNRDKTSTVNWQEALTGINRCIAVRPEMGSFYYELAGLYAQVKRYEDAIDNFDRCLQLTPEHMLAPHYRSMALVALDRWEEAVEGFAFFGERRELPKDPTRQFVCLQSYRHYPLALVKTGQYESAIEVCERAAKLYPEEYRVLYNVGKTYALASQAVLEDEENPERATLSDDWKAKSLASLSRAVDLGFPYFDYLEGDEGFASVRELPTYETIMARRPPDKKLVNGSGTE